MLKLCVPLLLCFGALFFFPPAYCMPNSPILEEGENCDSSLCPNYSSVAYCEEVSLACRDLQLIPCNNFRPLECNCDWCGGAGQVCKLVGPFGEKEIICRDCSKCGGSGKKDCPQPSWHKCDVCKGSGKRCKWDDYGMEDCKDCNNCGAKGEVYY